MAIVSLIALLAALGLAALAALQPWDEDAVGGGVGVAPGLGVALGDAVAVSPSQRLAVSAARPAVSGPQLAARVVASGQGSSAELVSVAPARVVMVKSPATAPDDPPESSQPALPEPQPAPAPVAVPVASPSPAPAAASPVRPGSGSGGSAGGGTAGGPGPIGGEISGPVEIYDGDEYVYSFTFYVEPSAYRAPGEENLILRFADETGGSHTLGLQLWDDGSGSQRGLWSSGDAMDGERFLAPLSEGVGHQLVLYFQASSEGDGLYLLLLDGEPIDTRAWVSLIAEGSDFGLLEAGLFRDGERVTETPDVLFGPARLDEDLESVIP